MSKSIRDQFRGLGYSEQADKIDKSKKEKELIDSKLKGMAYLNLDRFKLPMTSPDQPQITLAAKYLELAIKYDWSRKLLSKCFVKNKKKDINLYQNQGKLGEQLLNNKTLLVLQNVRNSLELISDLISDPTKCKNLDFKKQVLTLLEEYDKNLSEMR